jgi:hypothetical protein
MAKKKRKGRTWYPEDAERYKLYVAYAAATKRSLSALICHCLDSEVGKHLDRIQKKASKNDVDERVRQIVREEIARLSTRFPRAGEGKSAGGLGGADEENGEEATA